MKNYSINIEENALNLSSFLNESAFGHTDLGNLITEPGIIATVNANGNVKRDDWKFNKIFTSTDGTVVFTGNSFNGTTLLDIFENNSDEREKGIAALRVLDEIIRNDDEIILPGALGILVSDKASDGSFDVLVLPGNLFERCAQISREYDLFQGPFINKALKGKEAALFTRAVIAYRVAAGKYPFTQVNQEKRQTDYADENFVPLQLEVNGIDKELAEIINAGLSVKAKKFVLPGERRFENEKAEKNRLAIIKRALDFSTDKMLLPLKPESEAVFKAKKNNFISRQKKIVYSARFYRRNQRRIWGSIALITIALYGINSFNKENRKLATSMGLTSSETVETLFTGIHNADVTIVQEVAKGKETKSLIQAVSGFFVSNKERYAMDERNGTLSPAQWLFFKGQTSFWQYGITDFKIDGKEASTSFKFPRRFEKKQPLTEENGEILVKGKETSHSVTYNLIHNEGDNVISVISADETVKLKWNGKRWIVTSIKGKSKTYSYRAKDYKAKWMEALEATGEKLNEALPLLDKTYSFAPSAEELKAAAPYMIKKYNLKSAKEYIK